MKAKAIADLIKTLGKSKDPTDFLTSPPKLITECVAQLDADYDSNIKWDTLSSTLLANITVIVNSF